ncbi:type III effector protein [Streptomyces sp. NRRL F-5630]|uniref:type III effector protein n=2 Tax=unclassified Streptomyces TaxID=2593676 RepID=UPI003D758265
MVADGESRQPQQRHQRPAPPGMPLPAVTAALETIADVLREARTTPPTALPAPGTGTGAEQALAALLLLRQLREQLGGWETGLIEDAREAGASWADLAGPLGVANRQSAERRYLRRRPGAPGSTGEERIQATRDRRAADRALTTWAREHAATLRGLAAEVVALDALPAPARTPLAQALGHQDPAQLLAPLKAARPHLLAGHPGLAARVDALAPGPANTPPDDGAPAPRGR